MLKNKRLGLLIFGALLAGATGAFAQSFGASSGMDSNSDADRLNMQPQAPTPTQAQPSSANEAYWSATSRRIRAVRANANVPEAAEQSVGTAQPVSAASEQNAKILGGAPAQTPAAVNKKRQVGEFFIPTDQLPQAMRPTLDGVQRGRVSVYAVADSKKAKSIEEGKIFLYYQDFAVNRSINGSVSCDVTFLVLTTLDRKLANISYKLKWPSMLTTLTFDDVAPNTPTHRKYTLLGDGCYSMDKIPNVIVNRCRVKNMSQQDCAQSIRWLKKAR